MCNTLVLGARRGGALLATARPELAIEDDIKQLLATREALTTAPRDNQAG